MPAEVRTQVPKDAIVADDTREKVRPLQIGSISYLTINVELERLCAKCGGPLLLLHETQTWPRATLETLRPVLWWTVGGTIVSLLVVTVIASRFSRRIREVRRRTRTIVGGNYEPMPLTGCNDELRDLCLAVNQMAGELAMFSERLATTERLRLLGQIGGGLAHQLRNGVAGARLAVQVHMRERPQEADAEPLRVALTQLELVERRVRGFLDLGSGQPGEQVLLSLTRLVDETVQLFHPRCRHANVQLEWTRPGEPSMVEGETGRLQQLVVNLIDNAIDAAGPAGNVAVRLRRTGPATVLLEVLDDGPGPPPEIAEKLFEPFITSKAEGVGLGLGGLLAGRARSRRQTHLEQERRHNHVFRSAADNRREGRRRGGTGADREHC